MNEAFESDRPSLFVRLFGRWEARDVAPLVSLALLVIFFSFAAPSFLKPSSLKLILTQGSVLAIVAAGLTFVLLTAEIDLSVGMMALWSACLCGWLFERWAMDADRTDTGSWWQILAIVGIPLAACLALGLMTGVLTVWSRLPSFIISLAMMFIAEGAAKYLTKSEMFYVPDLLKTVGNRGVDGELFDGVGLGWVPWFESFTLPYSAILAAAVLLVGHLILRHTRFGRYVYMTGGNREAARLAGVRTGLIIVACLAICAVTAGMAGLINSGRMTNVTLDQNKDLLLSAVACVVLGGTSLFGGEGSMGKTLIGVLTFTVLNVGLMRIMWIDDLARQLLTGVVLAVALVINGVLAKR